MITTTLKLHKQANVGPPFITASFSVDSSSLCKFHQAVGLVNKLMRKP